MQTNADLLEDTLRLTCCITRLPASEVRAVLAGMLDEMDETGGLAPPAQAPQDLALKPDRTKFAS